MKFVYLVMRGEGYGKVIGIYAKQIDATHQVNINAQVVHGIDPKTEPLDFSGALCRYGWANRIWWQKEIVYD